MSVLLGPRHGLSWEEVDGIMSRAVERGLAKREESAPTRIRLDETSFQRRHEYVMVVTVLDASRVVAVLDDRTRESVDAYFSAIPQSSQAKVEEVAIHMGDGGIRVIDLAESRIVSDRSLPRRSESSVTSLRGRFLSSWERVGRAGYRSLGMPGGRMAITSNREDPRIPTRCSGHRSEPSKTHRPSRVTVQSRVGSQEN